MSHNSVPHLPRSTESVATPPSRTPAHELRQQSFSARPSFDSLSPGLSVLSCHEVTPSGPVVVLHNNCSVRSFRGEPFPYDIVPEARSVAALSSYMVPAINPREIAVTLPLLPGMKEFYRSRGMIESESQVIEVKGGSSFGWPDGDVVSSLTKSYIAGLQGAYAVTSFPSDAVVAHLESLGLQCVQGADPQITNNKAHFRAASEQYGFPVCGGHELQGFQDIGVALERLPKGHRLWLKLAHGAGGDTVIPLEAPVSVDDVERGIQRLRNSVELACREHKFPEGVNEQYWPKNAFAPSHSALTIEVDASSYGTVECVGSFAMLVSKSGQVDVGTFYRQIVDGGVFLGGEPFQISGAIREKLEAGAHQIARYSRESLGLFGLVGVDVMIVKGADNQVDLRFIELNGRPINNVIGEMVANKLGCSAWLNVKIQCPEGISSVNDLRKRLTVNGRSLLDGTADDGIAMPTVLDAHVIIDGKGERKVLSPATSCRLILASRKGQAHCHELLSQIR